MCFYGAEDMKESQSLIGTETRTKEQDERAGRRVPSEDKGAELLMKSRVLIHMR